MEKNVLSVSMNKLSFNLGFRLHFSFHCSLCMLLLQVIVFFQNKHVLCDMNVSNLIQSKKVVVPGKDNNNLA
jgi:hypothetical protein